MPDCRTLGASAPMNKDARDLAKAKQGSPGPDGAPGKQEELASPLQEALEPGTPHPHAMSVSAELQAPPREALERPCHGELFTSEGHGHESVWWRQETTLQASQARRRDRGRDFFLMKESQLSRGIRKSSTPQRSKRLLSWAHARTILGKKTRREPLPLQGNVQNGSSKG